MISAGILWIIYIAVVILSFLLVGYLGAARSFGGKWWVNAFLALLLGAIVVYVLTPFVTLNTQSDRTWLGVLLLVAYILPLVAALFMIWSMYWGGCGSAVANGDCHTTVKAAFSPERETLTVEKVKVDCPKETLKIVRV